MRKFVYMTIEQYQAHPARTVDLLSDDSKIEALKLYLMNNIGTPPEFFLVDGTEKLKQLYIQCEFTFSQFSGQLLVPLKTSGFFRSFAKPEWLSYPRGDSKAVVKVSSGTQGKVMNAYVMRGSRIGVFVAKDGFVGWSLVHACDVSSINWEMGKDIALARSVPVFGDEINNTVNFMPKKLVDAFIQFVSKYRVKHDPERAKQFVDAMSAPVSQVQSQDKA